MEKTKFFHIKLEYTLPAFYEQIECAECCGFKLKDFKPILTKPQIKALQEMYLHFEKDQATLNAEEFAQLVVAFANFDNNHVVASLVEFQQLRLV